MIKLQWLKPVIEGTCSCWLFIDRLRGLARFMRKTLVKGLAFYPGFTPGISTWRIGMKDNTCIFCKIANGEIPSRTLYEDDRYRVILDLGPATKGHALVLPKEHFADVYEIPADWAAGAMKIGQQMAIRMKEKPFWKISSAI